MATAVEGNRIRLASNSAVFPINIKTQPTPDESGLCFYVYKEHTGQFKACVLRDGSVAYSWWGLGRRD